MGGTSSRRVSIVLPLPHTTSSSAILSSPTSDPFRLTHSAREMMYTPTPSARRPKPPGSINRRGPAGDTPLSLASAQQVAHTLMTADESDRENAYRHSHISPGPSAVESIASEPPSSGYARHRHDIARSALARITASPSEAGDVSVALDFKESSPTSAVGLGLSSSAIIRPAVSLEATAQPSPPPPYGQGLRPATPDNGEHHTPPQPDSGAHSRCGSLSLSHFPPDLDIDTEQPAMAEEKLRAQRAKEAARAIGLDFGAGRTQSEVTLSSSSEEAEISDEEDMKARLRAARRELKARNNGMSSNAAPGYNVVLVLNRRTTHGCSSRRSRSASS